MNWYAIAQKKPDPYGAISAIKALGYANPLNERETVIDGAVKVEVSHYDDTTIWLKSIAAITPQQGHGTSALNKITAIAEEHNVAIYLDPMPFGGQGGIKSRKLVEWYKRNGFGRGAGEFQHGMVWKPSSANKDTPT